MATLKLDLELCDLLSIFGRSGDHLFLESIYTSQLLLDSAFILDLLLFPSFQVACRLWPSISELIPESVNSLVLLLHLSSQGVQVSRIFIASACLSLQLHVLSLELFEFDDSVSCTLSLLQGLIKQSFKFDDDLFLLLDRVLVKSHLLHLLAHLSKRLSQLIMLDG